MAPAAVSLRLLLLSLSFLTFAQYTLAYPLTSHIVPRSSVILKTSTTGNISTIDVFNSQTLQPITQVLATDGSGNGLTSSPASILWVVYCFLFGCPLALAGIRGWRLTTGAAIGLASGVCGTFSHSPPLPIADGFVHWAAWAAFINTVSAPGISDFLLTLIIFAFTFLGLILGVLPFMRVCGIAVLGLVGGIAFGVRILILKAGLLVASVFFVNWLLASLFGILGGVLVLVRQRAGILICSASAGTFLVGLGIDLIVNEQDGLSRGLRFLFDRNTSHLADLLVNGYHPLLSAQIDIALSLIAIPLLAWTQHRIFRDPFTRDRPRSFLLTDDNLSQSEKPDGNADESKQGTVVLRKPLVSRFSL
ncbi:hypothetical protein EW146_g2350 [Bondarzewia mesenterica]|uniref:TM7S3/TM198-like domain-containing protein n=1 Tax=Bondarzewia mesenterica TaxID=1095465 RepID=A0A4S4M2D7_9AGAM|nr:hypothetical protein EW146_g2350 [Bondarzewia mesenterica]